VRGRTLTTPNIFVVVDPHLRNAVPCTNLASEFGVQAVFTNAYLIYRNPTLRDTVAAVGSIHQHLGFDGIIATDSGAFQNYMYEEDVDLAPADIEAFEEEIDADCPVILDLPVQLDDPLEIARDKVAQTIARAKDNLQRRQDPDRAWFGPLHGSKYLDVLQQSTTEMSALDFGIYAVGGVVKIFNQYRFDLGVQCILTARQHVRPDRPLHVFGLGLPQFFALAVACGADTFDSAAYALFAKEGRYFSLDGTRRLGDLEEFPCCCPACASSTPAEVRQRPPPDQEEFLARHNLHVTMTELRAVREAIREGTLWDLVEARVRAHPHLLEALRVARQSTLYFDRVEPRYATRGLSYTGSETLGRAAVRRAVQSLLQEYAPPRGKNLAILLPEVDTTPRLSPASRGWVGAISGAVELLTPRLHFLHASSLFGLVPEELLDAYPFSQSIAPIWPDEDQKLQHATIVTAYFRKHAGHYGLAAALRPASYLCEHGDEVRLEAHAIDALPAHQLEEILPFQVFHAPEALAAWVSDQAPPPKP
jgi:7-cyano-7-deazaguanine tRNA-ribosyltransferase